ncbi:hypothetical protein [Arenicella xantha]|uniref:Uncharacterized protein n=1 Tax=Arenicella xantha TaxID=644221 RepID=A0A395JK35_9GAMM|nr:hypothetical protein [Arenicella xantha]RBP51136.1 hypothetical protein DFR28_102555 [Arenicella xantha]
MNNIKLRILSLIYFGMFAVLPFAYAESSNHKNYPAIITDIQACSAASVDAERLSCFDALAQSVAQPNTQVSVESSNNKEPETLPDNIGGGKFNDNTETPVGVRGLVTSCQKAHDGKWFYIFSSGQVWKQTDRSKRRYRECHFYVTIFEDGFGYKMRVDDETRITRIKRHK